MRKALKYLAINLFVVAALITLVNVAAVTVFKTKHFFTKNTNYKDPRAELTNYRSVPWAVRHFDEFNNLPAAYRSFIGWRRLPYNGETIHIDLNGVRLSTQSKNVSDTAPVIVFLGGSTIWGTGVPDSLTIPSIVSSMTGGNYRVMNFGESDYNAFQSFIFLQLQIMQGLKPSIVISYDGVNNAFVPGKRLYSDARENQIAAVMKGKDKQSLQQTMSYKHVLIDPMHNCINAFGNNERSNEGLFKKATQAEQKQTAIELLESWLAMQQLCISTGATFFAVLQPNAYVGHPKLNHLTLHNIGNRDYSYYPHVLELLKLPRYQSLQTVVFDYTHKFDRDEYIYIDEFHVSPNGNRIIAENLFVDIIQTKPLGKRSFVDLKTQRRL